MEGITWLIHFKKEWVVDRTAALHVGSPLILAAQWRHWALTIQVLRTDARLRLQSGHSTRRSLRIRYLDLGMLRNTWDAIWVANKTLRLKGLDGDVDFVAFVARLQLGTQLCVCTSYQCSLHSSLRPWILNRWDTGGPHGGRPVYGGLITYAQLFYIITG